MQATMLKNLFQEKELNLLRPLRKSCIIIRLKLYDSSIFRGFGVLGFWGFGAGAAADRTG